MQHQNKENHALQEHVNMIEHLCVYIYIFPPPQGPTLSLLVEGVNSTLCASFMRLKTLQHTACLLVFNFYMTANVCCFLSLKGNKAKTESVFRLASGFV